MSNRIREIVLKDQRLDPIETELRIKVSLDRVELGTQLRGRIIGPRCLYATTIEVAYPLREIARDPAESYVGMKVIIPEPNFWDPISPFLYEGWVELSQEGEPCDRMPLKVGLRASSLGIHGLRVSKKPLTLKGKSLPRLDEPMVKDLRASGVNLALLNLDFDQEGSFDLADRHGLLIIGRVSSIEAMAQTKELGKRPSALGWIASETLAANPVCRSALVKHHAPLGPWWGIEVTRSSSTDLPAGVSFVFGDIQARQWMEESALPGLILHDGDPGTLPPFWLGDVLTGK